MLSIAFWTVDKGTGEEDRKSETLFGPHLASNLEQIVKEF